MLRSNPNPTEDKKLEAPQAPPPPVQVLDAIAFEGRFERNEIDLVSFNYNETPENVAAAIKKVSLREKLSLMAANTISSLGLGLGSTIGILLKFSAPLAIGGAGLAIATEVMIGLSTGAGLLAIGLAFFVHKFYTKEAIKNAGILLSQIEGLDKKIDRRAGQILGRFQQSFAMLLQMTLALEQLKRHREQSNPQSLPTPTEKEIRARIDNYIDFLVKDPSHPNFNKIKDDEIAEENEKREAQIRKALERQYHIRNKLNQACTQILNDPTISPKDYARLAKDYAATNTQSIRDACFPPLRFIAAKTKLPNILTKPAVGLSFLGTFSGTIGLSYTSIGLITAFTVLPIAFPPLYIILGLAFVIATFTAYNVYHAKKIEAQRNIDKRNRQKHLSYFYDSNKLLKDRYTEELTQYNSYQPEIVHTQPSPKPQPSPEFKRQPSAAENELSLLQKRATDFNPSSNQDLTISTAGEDLRFNDPSQLTNLNHNKVDVTQTPQQLPEPSPPPEEVKRVEQTIPSVTTPGLSMFSNRLDFVPSSTQDLPRAANLENEDLRFNDPSQLTKLNTATANANLFPVKTHLSKL